MGIVFFLMSLCIILELFSKTIVEGTNIKVRTGISKMYEFDVREIEKIVCESTHSSKHGRRDFIVIYAKSRELKINMADSGAGKMAEYLLRLYESGILKPETISCTHKKSLVYYTNRNKIKKIVVGINGEGYKTIVKTQKNTILKDIMPLGMWLILFFASLFMLSVTEFAVLLIGIMVLSLIPFIYFWAKKVSARHEGENGWEYKKIICNVINGELYIDNKIMNVTKNKSNTEIYINESINGIATGWFRGIIEEPYVNDFIKFLDQQGVVIDEE